MLGIIWLNRHPLQFKCMKTNKPFNFVHRFKTESSPESIGETQSRKQQRRTCWGPGSTWVGRWQGGQGQGGQGQGGQGQGGQGQGGHYLLLTHVLLTNTGTAVGTRVLMDMNTPLQHLELTCLIQSLLYGMWTKMAAWKNSILTLVFIRITLPPWFSVMSMLVQPLAIY